MYLVQLGTTASLCILELRPQPIKAAHSLLALLEPLRQRRELRHGTLGCSFFAQTGRNPGHSVAALSNAWVARTCVFASARVLRSYFSRTVRAAFCLCSIDWAMDPSIGPASALRTGTELLGAEHDFFGGSFSSKCALRFSSDPSIITQLCNLRGVSSSLRSSRWLFADESARLAFASRLAYAALRK